MKNNLKKDFLILLAACLLTYIFYLSFEFIFTDGQMGVPLDDTWIHFQFADNFSKGYFFQYNPGEPTAGTTSPLYVVVLGSAGLITNNFIFASIFLSALFQILTVIYVYRISFLVFSQKDSPSNETGFVNAKFVSMIVAMLTIFSGRLVWSALSGMETTMFTFFCVAGIYYHSKNLTSKTFGILPAVLFTLAAVTRPEGVLLYLIYFSDAVANFIKDKDVKPIILKLILAILVFLVLTLPYFVFSYTISGNFLPNTFRGQGGGFSIIPDFNYLRIAVIYFFRDNFVTAVLYLSGMIFYFLNFRKYFGKFRLVNVMFLWIVMLPLAFSIFIPNWRHHVRYLIPLIPFINLISIYILFSFLKLPLMSGLRNFISNRKYAFNLIVCVSFVYFIVYAVALGKNTANINDQQVKLAHWVIDNTGKDETIALNDIGAITFLSKRKIIDMAGLVTPEFLKFRTYTLSDNLDSMNYILKKNNVSYIIIYDDWFKEFLNKYRNNLTFVTSAVLEDNTICGGTEMKVYKTNFRKND